MRVAVFEVIIITVFIIISPTIEFLVWLCSGDRKQFGGIAYKQLNTDR